MRFLATWELGHRLGHVAKLAAIAPALQARGHTVLLAAREVSAGYSVPPGTFETVLQAPIVWGDRSVQTPRTYAELIADGGFGPAMAAGPVVRSWLALFDLLSPDAIIAEHAPASLLAAYIAGLPGSRIGTSFTAPEADRMNESLTPWEPGLEKNPNATGATGAIRSILKAHERPDPGGLSGLMAFFEPYLCTWPELDHLGARADSFYYGPLDGWASAAAPEWPAGGPRRAFIYLPFDHPSAAALADALGRLGWAAIWHGGGTPAFPLPATVSRAAAPVDLARALPDADVLVSRASHGASAQALRHGIPSLLLPDGLETALLTYRLMGGGFGLAPRAADPDARALAGLLDRLAGDGPIRAACRTAAARYQGYDPAAAARELVDDLLSA